MKITLPGLIDVHTHLRTPGQSYKEDFFTGSAAALSGGFTTIIDMPNNLVPITTKKLLDEKINIAKKETIANIGFHFGSLGENSEEFRKVEEMVFGLKVYLNQTTGGFIIKEKELNQIYESWDGGQPILLHAEDDVLDMVFEIVKRTKKKTHICHISSGQELSKILNAKSQGLPVTCGVTPHHLFLTKDDEKKLGSFGKMKPFLKSKKDVNFLWNHIKEIDVVESDHAPHTISEKEKSFDEAPFGVPGLDTTLPLLLSSVEKGDISLSEIKRLCLDNPSRIFNIDQNEETKIEVSIESFIFKRSEIKSKCGWSPFEGMRGVGKVNNVYIKGRQVMKHGEIIAKKGEGSIILPHKIKK